MSGGNKSIYVGNLPRSVSETEFQELFSDLGPIQSAVLKEGKSKDGSQMFKFGFINFENESSVDAAIASCGGKVVQGRILTVRVSERSKKAQGGGRQNQTWNGGAGQSGPRPTSRGAEDVQKKLQGYEEFVTITHPVNPQTVYVQALNKENLEKCVVLMQKLQECCQNAPGLNGILPDRNQLYGAIFELDGMWYRAKVIKHGQGKAEVLYVDYGNSAEVAINSLVVLSDDLASLSPLAQKIRIIGVAPQLKDLSLATSQQAFEFLSQLDDDGGASKKLRVVIAEGATPCDDGSLPVQLFSNNVNVADTMNGKFAPGYQGKKLQYQHQGGVASTSSTSGGGGGGGGRMTGSRPGAGGGNRSKAGGDTNGVNGRHDNRSHLSTSDAMLIKVTHKVKNLEDIVEQLREEKIVLQKQLLNVKAESQEEVKRVGSLLSNALEVRLSSLAESYERVKEARRCFMVASDQKTTMQLAIELATSRLQPFAQGSPTKEKGDLISLIPDSEPVGSMLQELETMQQAVQNITSQEELPEAMLKRNEARHEAYKALTSFVDDIKNLPIDVRLKDIECMVEQLSREYSSYLDPSKVMKEDEIGSDVECFDKYQTWLAERNGLINPLRGSTDNLRAQWCQLLSAMHGSFQSDDSPAPSLENIDQVRDEFLVAMETEITFTVHGYVPLVELDDPAMMQSKQEQDVKEVEVVSSTVRALMRALDSEKQTLGSLAQVCANFSTMGAQLHPWLNQRPDVAPLQATMKEIKLLRSRLRHKMADRHDMKEDPDLYEDKSLVDLEGEIQEIQAKLWSCYKEENDLLRELGELTTNHFPELPCLHPTFGISKHLETNGLVREGRDLKHFDLSPLTGCEKTTVKVAKVNQEPVCIIKVIHLPDKETLDKIVAYSVIAVPNCMMVEAVYTEPDASQLFLQLPFMGLGNLQSALHEPGLLTKADVIAVIREVLGALEGLHRLGLVHGGLHPRNVLLERLEGVQEEEEGEQPRIVAKLSEFDFTKTTSETALKGFTTPTGLTFTAPEVNCGLQATSQADIFAAGLLLLWALFPMTEFKMEADGLPNVDGCNLPPSLGDLLAAMLNYCPSRRPSAARVLEASFFTDPPSFAEDSPLEEEAREEGEGNEEEGKNEGEGVEGEEKEGEQKEEEETDGDGEEKGKIAAEAETASCHQPKQNGDKVLLVEQESEDREEKDKVCVAPPGDQIACELTVSQDSCIQNGRMTEEQVSDCESEPPPLMDDEELEKKLADEISEAEQREIQEASDQGSKETREAAGETDDNSSPV